MEKQTHETTFRMSEKLYQELKEESDRTGVPISALIRLKISQNKERGIKN